MFHLKYWKINDLQYLKELLKFYRDAEQPKLLAKRKTIHYGKGEDLQKVLMESECIR